MNPSSLPYFDLNDIDFIDRIGRGNFSVYKATLQERMEIAVKKMDCDKNEIPREVTVQSNLPSHPNVLPLLGITHSSDGFAIYICMELADKSLHHYLHTEKKKPSLQKSTKWAMQIAKGMHHIHQHGVAHRDLKSANVLLFEREDIIKICDFGVARPLDKTATMTGMAGTHRWMAPELNEKADMKINQRCDVFSYGMVLYEIYAHKLPFADLDDGEILPRIRNKERPPILPDFPMHIEKLINFCWKHEPHDRPTFGIILQLIPEAELHEAATSGDADVVQQLMADHVDVNSQTLDGKTALHLASEHGHVTIVQILIRANANLNLQDKNGCSPLHVARQEGHSEVADILLQCGADPNVATTVLQATDQLLHHHMSNIKWQKAAEIRGDGRFGKMFECHNVETGERMVMKEISIQEQFRYQVQKAILERTDPLKKLDHPNVLKFIGVEFHDVELCIFMEYCGGGTLQEIAAQGLREDMVRHYTRDLLKAVETLHNKEIVHRNIKGSSIFLFSNGSIKLGDFGMALELRGNLSKKTLKECDADISYLSPEVVLKQRFAKPMDIWSVGCVVVEMATGKEPWSDYSKEDIIVKLSSGKCPVVQSRLLGKEGQDFLQTHCFITDPDKRATAVQLLKHIFIQDYIIAIDDLDLESGKYLGGGTSGDVYSGIWLSRNIEVAVKKVRCEPSESDVKILSSLCPHPNITTFYGYARTSLYTYIVTELAKNGSLYDRLHSKEEEEDKEKGKTVNKPTQKRCLTWAKEIAQGMVYLHHLEIIHRDLKSGNVLLTAEDTAKLCDFGTARYFPRRDLEQGRQGTYRWMAPEVIDGGSADKHSDVYSFSMVLWELMAHKIPFNDVDDELDAASCALEKERPKLDDSWPEYIRVLIEKCWSHHPHFRPSFDDIVTVLSHKSCMK